MGKYAVVELRRIVARHDSTGEAHSGRERRASERLKSATRRRLDAGGDNAVAADEIQEPRVVRWTNARDEGCRTVLCLAGHELDAAVGPDIKDHVRRSRIE